ncbi:RidA family protein [Paraburkholderia xenovorans]
MKELPFDPENIPKPAGSYEVVLILGKTAYISGQVSRTATGILAGKVGNDADLSLAREAARISTQRCLAAIHQQFGNLDVIEQVLMVRGFINADPDFTRHPEVMDAASEWLITALGKRGHHARAAVGVASLPGGGLTEIEMTVALK